MLQLIKFWKHIWAKTLYKDINLNIGNQVVTILWPNGSWKTTLFRCLSWLDKDFDGEISFQQNSPLIGYMEQEMKIEWEETIIDYLKKVTGLLDLENEISDLYSKLTDSQTDQDAILSLVGDKQEQFERLGGYDIDSRINQVLAWLWFQPEESERNIRTLSWWQKRRVLLASIFLKWIDLILLDEPTNDLDIPAIFKLIDFIKSQVVTTLIISHDIDFIKSVSSRILEINPLTQDIESFNGSYDEYVLMKEKRFEKEMTEYEAATDEKIRLNKLLQEERSQAHGTWPSRKDNDKWANNRAKEKAQDGSWKKINRIKQKMEEIVIVKPIQKKPLKFDLTPSDYARWVFLMRDVQFIYPENDKFILNIRSFECSAWDRIVILWNNWAWKSTLINLITWEAKASIGEILINGSFRFGIFNQWHQDLLNSKNAVNYIEEQYTGSQINNWDILKALARFGIKEEDTIKDTELLSPGQRARIILALFNLNKYNTLILDEPTNHLDLEAVWELIRTLNEFPWTLIVISHDLNFIRSLNFKKTYISQNWLVEEIWGIDDYIKTQTY